jgi:hypothetical protein
VTQVGAGNSVRPQVLSPSTLDKTILNEKDRLRHVLECVDFLIRYEGTEPDFRKHLLRLRAQYQTDLDKLVPPGQA